MNGSTGGGDSSGMGCMERRLERERRRSGRLKDGRWRMGTKVTSSGVSAELSLCEAGLVERRIVFACKEQTSFSSRDISDVN